MNDGYRSVALTDDDLRVRFPEHDYDGYWMFGGIRGDGPWQALLVGLSLGVNDGYDWGFIDVKPDTNFCLYALNLIGREECAGYLEQPIHRHRFRYDRRRLDIRLDDRLHVTGEWPRISYYVASADRSLIVELEGHMSIAHWSPDMILRGTSWVTVAIPDLHFQGQVTVHGERHEISGIGTLDHPMGRLFQSPTSPGMGHWEYNCMMLNERYGLYQWNIVDGNGEILASEAVTDFPDGRYHVGRLQLEYLDYEDRGPVHVPRAWRCRIEADHGTFEHVVRAVGQPWDGTPHRVGAPLPNFLLLLEGEFTGIGGSRVQVRGKGTGETVISERDPRTGRRQKPW